MTRKKHKQRALEEQEVSFQRLVAKRLESQAEEHHKAMAKKEDDIKAGRKALRKMDDKLQRAREKYDEKVCDYEELVLRMEEQKFEAMQNMREKDVVVFEEGQDRVRDALKQTKEAKKARADKFMNGEVSNALAGFRGPAGGAMAKASRGARDTTRTPPSPRTPLSACRRSSAPAPPAESCVSRCLYPH